MATRIDGIVQEFVARLEAAIREQVRDELRATMDAALGGGGRARNGHRAGRAPATRAAARGRRSPAELARHTARLLGYIKANPGQRAEQIAKGTGLATGLISLPLKKLVAEKRLATKGLARGTTYTLA